MKQLLRFSFTFLSILLIAIASNVQLPVAITSYGLANNHMITPNNPILNPTTISLESWIKADSWGVNSWENVTQNNTKWH